MAVDGGCRVLFDIGSSGESSEAKAHKSVAAHGMCTILRFDRGRQRICGEIDADRGLEVEPGAEYPCITARIGSDAEGAAELAIDLKFELGRIREELIPINQLRAAGEQIVAGDREHRF